MRNACFATSPDPLCDSGQPLSCTSETLPEQCHSVAATPPICDKTELLLVESQQSLSAAKRRDYGQTRTLMVTEEQCINSVWQGRRIACRARCVQRWRRNALLQLKRWVVGPGAQLVIRSSLTLFPSRLQQGHLRPDSDICMCRT